MPKTKQPKNIFRKVIEEVVDDKLAVFEIKMDHKFNKMIEEVNAKAEERHNMVMITLDKIMELFKNHHEEHDILSDQQHRVNENSERLDKPEAIHPNTNTSQLSGGITFPPTPH